LRKLRISVVQYLNTAPLVYGFTHGALKDKYELSFTVPSQCADDLRDRRADVAIIPAIEFQRIDDLVVLPDLAIAAKKRITIVDVAAPRMLLAHGFLRSIFEAFDRHKVSIDVVSTSEVSVSLTVDSNQAIPALAADLAKLADVKYEGRKAIVCLVGENLRETPGIAAKVFGLLENTKIRMISQGASEINMSFMIDEEDADEAVRSLHAAFFQNPDPTIFDVEARKAAASL